MTPLEALRLIFPLANGYVREHPLGSNLAYILDAHEVLNFGGWRPIDTAPKTNHAILIYVPSNQCIYEVTWLNDSWYIFGGGYRSDLSGATHWQPLPEPPAA